MLVLIALMAPELEVTVTSEEVETPKPVPVLLCPLMVPLLSVTVTVLLDMTP